MMLEVSYSKALPQETVSATFVRGKRFAPMYSEHLLISDAGRRADGKLMKHIPLPFLKSQLTKDEVKQLMRAFGYEFTNVLVDAWGKEGVYKSAMSPMSYTDVMSVACDCASLLETDFPVYH